MRIPDGLEPLLDYGVLEEVIRPLMSGKEAQVYLVVSNGQVCVAKVYKEAQNRSFKNRADYTEGRTTRNSRDQRAMSKRSKHGRAQDEAAWRSTEVDMIHRLHAAGVRVPVPHHFVEGVLLMEMVRDADGNPAPRLGDLRFTPDEARAMYDRLLREVVRMLCAGVVHGDLSDFNVLVGAQGPVIIDFPQSVDTARNPNARRLLLRDVENLHEFLRRWVPGARRLPFAEEMWDLHEANLLTPETRLEGRYRSRDRGPANTDAVLSLIRDANDDERKRRQALGLRGGESIPDAAPEKAAPPPPVSRYAQKMAQRRAELAANPPPAPPAPPPRPGGFGPGGHRGAPSRGPQIPGDRSNDPRDQRGPRPPHAPHEQRSQGRSETGPRQYPPQGHGGRGPHPSQGGQGQRPPAGRPNQHPSPSPSQKPQGPRPPQGQGGRPPQPPQGPRQPPHPQARGQRPGTQPQGPRPPQPGPPGGHPQQGPRPPRPQGQPEGRDRGSNPRDGKPDVPSNERPSGGPAPSDGGGASRKRRRRPEPVGTFAERAENSPPRDREREPRPSNAPRVVEIIHRDRDRDKR